MFSILKEPDERLRLSSQLVEDFGPEFQAFVSELHETCHLASGLGLAAAQVGVLQRVFVVHMPECGRKEFVNAQLLEGSGTVCMDEGCLSIPGVYLTTRRAATVKVLAYTRLGEVFEEIASGLYAVVLQHEWDHQCGVLFTDRLFLG